MYFFKKDVFERIKQEQVKKSFIAVKCIYLNGKWLILELIDKPNYSNLYQIFLIIYNKQQLNINGVAKD